MILKLGMQHKGLKLYKVYKNDDPDLDLFYMKVKLGPFEWGNLLQSYLMKKKLPAKVSID